MLYTLISYQVQICNIADPFQAINQFEVGDESRVYEKPRTLEQAKKLGFSGFFESLHKVYFIILCSIQHSVFFHTS